MANDGLFSHTTPPARTREKCGSKIELYLKVDLKSTAPVNFENSTEYRSTKTREANLDQKRRGSGEPVKAEPVRGLEGDKTMEEKQRNGIGGALKGHAAYARGGRLSWL